MAGKRTHLHPKGCLVTECNLPAAGFVQARDVNKNQVLKLFRIISGTLGLHRGRVGKLHALARYGHSASSPHDIHRHCIGNSAPPSAPSQRGLGWHLPLGRGIIVELVRRQKVLTDRQEGLPLLQSHQPEGQALWIRKSLQEDLVVPLDETSERFGRAQEIGDDLLMR